MEFESLASGRGSEDLQEDPHFKPEFEPEFAPADTQRRDERRWEQQKRQGANSRIHSEPRRQTCRVIRGSLQRRRKSVSIRPPPGSGIRIIGPGSLDAA